MSRIGKLPVVVPQGVTVEIKDGNTVSVKGNQTGRQKREQISSRPYTRPDQQHGRRRPHRLHKGSGSQWCRL